MAPKRSEMCIVLVVVVLLWGGATAQSSCTTALAGLSSCLNYVTGNTSTPTSLCCSTLSTVVQMQPQCLCTLWNARGSSLGLTVNQTLALQLPGACGVPTPSLSQCNASASGPATSAASPANPPSTSPAASAASPANPPSTSPAEDTPEAAAPTQPSVPSIPAGTGTGTGSKTVPSTTGSTSGGTNIRTPLHLVGSVLFVVTCASMAASF